MIEKEEKERLKKQKQFVNSKFLQNKNGYFWKRW